jgi:hypothetical protein
METKTTKQVAEELGLSETNLIVYLNRNPQLKPANRHYEKGAFLWTDEEIEAVRQARAIRGTGRPKKQTT